MNEIVPNIKKKSINESIKLLMNSNEYHHKLLEETGYERQQTAETSNIKTTLLQFLLEAP